MKPLFIILFALGFFTPLKAIANSPTTYCHTASGEQICISQKNYTAEVCRAVDKAAKRYGINPDFFGRLIWQESGFNPNARSHMNAQGIAQFIPSTAKIRGLKNPYNPAEALDASAKYLADLIRKFGNEGMAAAAYNGGEGRAENYINRSSGLPGETRHYVHTITGYSAEVWRDKPPLQPKFALVEGMPFESACIKQVSARSLRNFKAPSPQSSEPPVAKWGVQLASHTSRSRAKHLYSLMKRRYYYILKNEQPNYIRTKIPGRGTKTRYVVRIGRNSRASANQLCVRLRNAGAPCAVYRN